MFLCDFDQVGSYMAFFYAKTPHRNTTSSSLYQTFLVDNADPRKPFLLLCARL